MRKPIKIWILVGLFFLILGLWLGPASAYPYTEYDVYETGDTAFHDYGGTELPRVLAIPTYEPDNPFWVDFIRTVSPITLMVLVVLFFCEVSKPLHL